MATKTISGTYNHGFTLSSPPTIYITGLLYNGTLNAKYHQAVDGFYGYGGGWTITNTGTMEEFDVGIYVQNGGTVTNGSPSAPQALIAAFEGIYLPARPARSPITPLSELTARSQEPDSTGPRSHWPAAAVSPMARMAPPPR